MVEQVHVLLGDGTVMVHDLPLPAGIADRVARDELKLVEPPSAPSDVESGPAEPEAPPAPKARKATKAAVTGE